MCGAEDGTVVASHSNSLRDGKGTGIKASDAMVASLCYTCHMEIDNGKKFTREKKRDYWEEAHRKTIKKLIEEEYLIVNPNKS